MCGTSGVEPSRSLHQINPERRGGVRDAAGPDIMRYCGYLYSRLRGAAARRASAVRNKVSGGRCGAIPQYPLCPVRQARRAAQSTQRSASRTGEHGASNVAAHPCETTRLGVKQCTPNNPGRRQTQPTPRRSDPHLEPLAAFHGQAEAGEQLGDLLQIRQVHHFNW